MARHPSVSHHVKAVAHGRFTYLLAFMFLLILAFPFLEESAYGPPVMQLIYSFLLISALYAAAQTAWGFRVGLLLFLVGLIAHWWMILATSSISVTTGVLSEIIFFCFIALILLSHVFGHEQVTSDTIAGAICVFLLVGIIWTLAYQLIFFFDGAAFNNIAAESISPVATVDLVYYSFSTLTTLGYGDITPISRLARMFAVTEAIVGQIYLTVLVARLVGLYAPVRASRAGQ